MQEYNEKDTERIIDFLNNPEEYTDEEIAAMTTDEQVMEAWRDMQDTMTALQAKMQAAPNADAAWKEFTMRNKAHGHRRLYIWSTVAAVAASLLLFFTLNIYHSNSKRVLYAARPDNADVETTVTTADDGQQPLSSETGQSVAKKTRTTTISVPEGKTHHLILPDGTEVWLNAQSVLTYPEDFVGNTRSVKLKGEAYFKVKRDADHPFIVASGRFSTKVLGTEFNVHADSASPHQVTLVTGHVQIISDTESVTMSPGENATLGDNGISVEKVDVDDYICWKNGVIYYNEAPLHEILMQIGSWYNLNVVCNNTKTLDTSLHFTYNRNMEAAEVINLLKGISDVKIVLKEHTIYIE